MAAPQAAPGAQVRSGPAWTRAARSSLTRQLPGPGPPRPSGSPPLGARGLSPARWPQRRPSSSISQPGPQLHAPPGMMQGWRHHRHRRRLRASREPRRAGGAEAPSRSRGGRRPLLRTLRPRVPPACRTFAAPRASSCPAAGRSRRARLLGLADRQFWASWLRSRRELTDRKRGEQTGKKGGEGWGQRWHTATHGLRGMAPRAVGEVAAPRLPQPGPPPTRPRPGCLPAARLAPLGCG